MAWVLSSRAPLGPRSGAAGTMSSIGAILASERGFRSYNPTPAGGGAPHHGAFGLDCDFLTLSMKSSAEANPASVGEDASPFQEGLPEFLEKFARGQNWEWGIIADGPFLIVPSIPGDQILHVCLDRSCQDGRIVAMDDLAGRFNSVLGRVIDSRNPVNLKKATTIGRGFTRVRGDLVHSIKAARKVWPDSIRPGLAPVRGLAPADQHPRHTSRRSVERVLACPPPPAWAHRSDCFRRRRS